MAVVVPGRGWCTVRGGEGTITVYGVLGPLADGDYLRRLSLTITTNGVTQGRFAATLGASEEASEVSLRAGMPLIQRSTDTTADVPSFFWHAVAGVPLWLWIPVGIVGSVGARYVVFVWTAAAADVSKYIMVGLDVLRFRKGPKEEPGQ